jgi:hypothetical protein
MPALLLSPITRWLAIGAVLAALAGYAAIERAGRQAARAGEAAAIQRAQSAEARIRHMEERNAQDDRARRSADPVGELRGEWSRD